MQYCAQPGCSQLVVRGYCPRHAHFRRPYYTVRWKQLRQQVLAEQAYECAQCGVVQRRLEVDHIVKHEGSDHRFWDRANLQALCPACHVAKTKRGA
jgi:5-methylcytosine-specific restriction endonuclease McrA